MYMYVSNHFSSDSVLPPVVQILVKGGRVYPVVQTRNIEATLDPPPLFLSTSFLKEAYYHLPQRISSLPTALCLLLWLGCGLFSPKLMRFGLPWNSPEGPLTDP